MSAHLSTPKRAHSANAKPRHSARSRRSAPAAAVAKVIEPLERRVLLSVNFIDHYTTDTSGNYTETMQQGQGLQDTWTVDTANHTLDYALTAINANTYATSVFLLKPAVANTSGLTKFTTSGDLIAPKNFQPGLVVSGDPTNGGFVVAEYDNGPYNNHLVLLRETGPQLVGDEGGVGNPPVLADFGNILLDSRGIDDSANTFHIDATVDRVGPHPAITVAITDLTDAGDVRPTQTAVDITDPANYGGNQIGWRARYQNTTSAFSVTNLALVGDLPLSDHAPAAPSGLTATQGAGVSVNLSWTNNADNAEYFVVERSTDGTNFTTLADVNSVAKGGTATFNDNTTAAGTTYSYRVRAFNDFGGGNGTLSDPSNVASVAVVVPTGSAKATFYNYGFWAGNPVDQTYVGAADFANTTNQMPDPNVNNGRNSVIFSGKIKTDDAGSYTFVSNTDEDGYLWVNGVLVSSDPGDHPERDATKLVPLTLAANTQYDFVFMQTWARYVGQDGDDAAHMEWITPANAGTAPVVIPADHLLPISDVPTTPNAPALVGSPTSNAVDLTFTANNNAVARYQLQRSGDGGTSWTTLTQIEPGDNGQTNGVPGTSATLQIEDAAPLPGSSYEYRVVAAGIDGSSAPSAASAAVNVPAYTTSANAPGVEAHYYNGELWGTGTPNQVGQPNEFQLLTANSTPAQSGHAANPPTGGIDYGIGGDQSPDIAPYPVTPRIHPISWSGVFTGKIKTEAAGTYTFVTNSDDEGYLYINDVLVSSDPGGHAPRDATMLTPIVLKGNTTYNFVFLFNQQAGGSAYHVKWIEPPENSGTAQGQGMSGGTPVPSTIILDPSADSNPADTKAYVGNTITITDGTDAGDTGVINAYDPTTRTATVTLANAAADWTTPPDNTSKYTIQFNGEVPMAGSSGDPLRTGGFLQASDIPHQQTVDATGAVTDTPAGSAAGNLALAPATGGPGVTLNWTDQSFSELWFEIQRSTSAAGPYTTIGTVGFGQPDTFTDTTATGGHYYYRVRGVNWDGAGPSAAADTVIGGGATDTITGTSGNDAITISKDTDGTDIDWTLNGGPVNKVAITDPNGLTINGNGGTDTITFDNTKGNPLPNLLNLNQTGAGSKFVVSGLQAIGTGQKVEIANSTVQVNYSGNSPLALIQGYLKGGQITSSAVAANPKLGIADIDSALGGIAGQPANTVLLQPALKGDTNLDHKVDFSDLVNLARNYGKTGQDWLHGDFDYNGKVDFSDLVALARNYGQTQAAVTPANANLAAMAIQAGSALVEAQKKKAPAARKH